ncbi:prepilin-type N-terminal cleavage/methylation domain-containing protein [Patescibacteria group bacterium]|nr:prepilin-type N-terminal cleavage/methylation domain-containing protein [Patescibacteria group bacterium]
MNNHRGYTLIELIIAVGLFALIMLLASGAYLMMISLSRHAQGIATGIDNLSFALETMTRNIRTGTSYNCGGVGYCTNGGFTFSFKNSNNQNVTYSLASATIQETVNGTAMALTDPPPAMTISSLTFYTFGTSKSDGLQPRVTIIVSGTVTYAAGKSEPFTVETGATMRGTDL